ncbi:MAG TPA: response regulator, partial [Candidatus Angelobacter sp.]
MTTLALETRQETLSILLIEDNLVDAKLVSRQLGKASESLNCRHVSRLGDALQILKAVQFDVILLDLNLEDSSGYETFSRILPPAASAAILVLSGSDDEELAIRTVREGAQDYLVKGFFDGRLLVRSIRYAFERKQSEEALRHSEATARAIFENSLDAILMIDSEAALLEANPAAAELLGLSRDILVQTRLLDFGDEELENEWNRFQNSRRASGRFSIRR